MRKLKVGLNKKTVDHRWVKNNELHIPLINLHDSKPEKLERLTTALSHVIADNYSFKLKLEGVWAYPHQGHGRLLWIGVQNSKNLRAIRDDLLTMLGIENDEVFQPILPIVRLRNHCDVTDLISPYKGFDFGKLTVRNISIYEMKSGGAFPVFVPVKTWTLMASDEISSHEHP